MQAGRVKLITVAGD